MKTRTFLICLSIALAIISMAPRPGIAPMEPYLNGVFPATAPDASWDLEEPFPGLELPGPLRILPFPGSKDLLVLCKLGEIWRISLENQTAEQVFDHYDKTFALSEAGTVGFALHPEFGNSDAPDKQVMFLFYNTRPNPRGWGENAYNRLSKFQWDADRGIFDPASEEVLFQQYDQRFWHNGGDMAFGKDGFLYITLGDEGRDPTESTQSLSNGFFSGMLRIDVDNDPARSHPIRRQPQATALPPNGWWGTFSQGYSIPNDNPWQDPDGGILEEFYAIGLRSPYDMFMDPETDKIWVADVGSDKREEINHVEKGDNLQWPFMEGTLRLEQYDKPEELIGQEKSVYFEYDRSVGPCIIGGEIYRGNLFPELNGKYLLADYIRGKLMALTQNGSQAEPELETLLTLEGSSVELPAKPGISGVYPIHDGHILITLISDAGFGPGKLYSLVPKRSVKSPPAQLSELGVFTNLNSLETIPGIVPYTINSPLWSDRAEKRRWMALPNDGSFDTEAEQIVFNAGQEWAFPSGTVFIKHFELPMDLNGQGITTKLETRFFVIDENGKGYGLTYKWNEEGTDAFLLGGGSSKEFDIQENGQTAFVQTWDYPSREQCLTCHNANAGYVLGLNTQQMNKDQNYGSLGTMNQLDFLNQCNAFHISLASANNYPKAAAIDDLNADLNLRIRSYFDSNCASCHRSGGVPEVNLDLRFGLPLNLTQTVKVASMSQNSDPTKNIIQPGAHRSSELWLRNASTEGNRMPPIASNIPDQVYLDALASWIDQLPENGNSPDEMLLFPNPTQGLLSISLPDGISLPVQVNIISLDGKRVYKTLQEFSFGQLSLGDLAPGTYLLEVAGVVKKFVKY